MTEGIRAFSQLCVYSGGVLSCCANSLYRAGFVHSKTATSGSPCHELQVDHAILGRVFVDEGSNVEVLF